MFFFDTELINENIKCNEDEIAEIKWFSYEGMIVMKEKLRANGYFLSTIINKIEGNVTTLDVKNTNK